MEDNRTSIKKRLDDMENKKISEEEKELLS